MVRASNRSRVPWCSCSRPRYSSCCLTSVSSKMRLNVRWRSQRSACGALTSGRRSFLPNDTRRPLRPPRAWAGKWRSFDHSHSQSVRSRVGSPRKSSTDGADQPDPVLSDPDVAGSSADDSRFGVSRALTGSIQSSTDRQSAGTISTTISGVDLSVNIDQNRMLAESLEAGSAEIDLALLHRHVAFGQRRDDVHGGDGTVEACQTRRRASKP